MRIQSYNYTFLCLCKTSLFSKGNIENTKENYFSADAVLNSMLQHRKRMRSVSFSLSFSENLLLYISCHFVLCTLHLPTQRRQYVIVCYIAVAFNRSLPSVCISVFTFIHSCFFLLSFLHATCRKSASSRFPAN